VPPVRGAAGGVAQPHYLEEIRSEQVFKGPAAPFSLATRTTGGPLLHVSGQVAPGLDGDTVGRGDIERQTIQVLENIKALVEAAGGPLTDVARIVVYLTAWSSRNARREARRRAARFAERGPDRVRSYRVMAIARP
jgi:2-iminobutanoate/2-iminopropanoate deaminase